MRRIHLHNWMDFRDYKRLGLKVKIDNIAKNVLENYLENQVKLGLNQNSINIIRNFVILFAKSLVSKNNKEIIDLKEIQCALVVIDYLNSFDIIKLLNINSTDSYKFFLRIESILNKRSVDKKIVFSKLFFSPQTLKLFEILEKQIISDLESASRKSKKNHLLNLSNEIMDSIRFLTYLQKNRTFTKVISELDVKNAVIILYNLLFQINDLYYYTLFDLYRLRFSDKYKYMAMEKVPEYFKTNFENSRLFNAQKIISKHFPPFELRNIGINNHPISTMIDHLFILESINNKVKDKNFDARYNKILNIIYSLIYEFENELISNKIRTNKVKINKKNGYKPQYEIETTIIDFFKKEFKKFFSMSAISFISFLKNFIISIFNRMFGRNSMLFKYTSLPQQILSFIVVLSLIDNYRNNNKQVELENLCRAVRLYTYLLLDFDYSQ